jgi:hypothetical protein
MKKTMFNAMFEKLKSNGLNSTVDNIHQFVSS